MKSFHISKEHYLHARIFLVVIAVIGLASWFRLFEPQERVSYDLRFKMRPALQSRDQIAIIEIDDDTLKDLRQWPLPRAFHATLVNDLAALGAKKIVFDLLFSEVSADDEVFLEAMARAGNVYLPAVYDLTEKSPKNVRAHSDRILGDVLGSYKKAIAGTGHANSWVDDDGKVRRMPLFVRSGGKDIPCLGLAVAAGEYGLRFEKISVGGGHVLIDDLLRVPVSSDGSFLVNYPGFWEESYRRFSYVKVLKACAERRQGQKPSLDLNVFKDKICFIGLTATGTADLRANPLEAVYPDVGVQVSMVDGLLQRKFIADAGVGVNTAINLAIFLLAVVLCLKYPLFKAFVFTAAAALLYFVATVVLFNWKGVWIDLFFPLVILSATYAGYFILRSLKNAEQKKLLDKEIEIAETIQRNFLPRNLEVSAGIGVQAFLKPAQVVGGDMYDVVKLGENKIGVLIADVMGEGVSSALVMAQTISLFRIICRQCDSAARTLTVLNDELCRALSGRFVTAQYLIIDTERRRIEGTSAGHHPLLYYRRADRSINESFEATGIPLGLMPEQTYENSEAYYETGDKLLMFTDGFFETRDKQTGKQPFGLDRIKKILSEVKDEEADRTLEVLTGAVEAFSGTGKQHDDMTAVLLQIKA